MRKASGFSSMVWKNPFPLAGALQKQSKKSFTSFPIRPKRFDFQYHSPLLLVFRPSYFQAVPPIWKALFHQAIFVKTKDMQALTTSLLIIHILCGFTALITGAIASFTKKGGKAHRRSGKWYFGAMTGVFVTAIAVSILKSLAFLFMVGFFSYYFVVRGYRQLYLKGLGRTQNAATIDWFITCVALAFGLGLIGWAVYQKLNGVSFWPVPLTFGIISASFAVADTRLYLNGPKYKQHWMASHIVSMGAGYIATWTAFIVTNVKFLPPVIVWLLPSVIGAILISKSVRRYVKPNKAQSLATSIG
jgi:uncharacterized membrane protein